MRRMTALRALAGALAVAVLAACSGSGSVGYPDLRGANLQVLGSWSGAEQAHFNAVLRVFSKDTGARVRYSSAHGHVAEMLTARLAAGSLPDVALLPQPGMLRRYARAGHLVPLDAATQAAVDNNYPRIWRRLAAVDGRDYGVWFKAANKSLIWYDVGTFERVGVVPPDTLAGLLGLAEVMHRRRIAAFSVGAGNPWTLTDWFENIYLRTAGPYRYDALAAHRLRWTDPSVAEALGWMRRLLAPPLLLGGTRGALRTAFEASVAAAFRPPARSSMVMEGDFVASVVSSSTTARVGPDVDVFPFPGGYRGRPLVVGGGDVAVELKRSRAAAELMRYLASPEAASIWAAAGGFVSPNLNVDLRVYPDQLYRGVARSLVEASDSFRFDLSDLAPAAFGSDPRSGMQTALREFLKSRDVAGAQRRLEAAAAAAWGGRRP